MDLRTLANQHEHLRVLEAGGEGIDILHVVVPDRYLVSVELVKARESTKRVEIVIEDRNLHGNRTIAFLLRYTSVLKYFMPESTISVTTVAPGPSRSAT